MSAVAITADTPRILGGLALREEEREFAQGQVACFAGKGDPPPKKKGGQTLRFALGGKRFSEARGAPSQAPLVRHAVCFLVRSVVGMTRSHKANSWFDN